MNNIIQDLLTTNDKSELSELLNSLVKDKDELIKFLNGINRKVLYASDFHGYHHSQKVALFTYLIAQNYDVSSLDLQILMDAAVYHDIGRQDDYEDEFHGFTSSMHIGKVVTNDIYKDEKNLIYLKLACEAHSMADEKFDRIFDNYYCENPDIDREKAKFIVSVLKDADALDRTRFNAVSDAALNEAFLRLPVSKGIVKLACDVNSHYSYLNCESKAIYYRDLYAKNNISYDAGCFHGIGFDFFKFASILKYGILSKFAATKNNVHITRNFNGRNKDFWISVVDASMVSKNGKAYHNFIENGISFFCFVPELYDADCNSKVKADYNNLAKSKEYIDEKYVANSIPYEQIHSIIIPRNVRNTSVGELNYLYGSNNLDILREKVFEYARNIEEKSDIKVDRSIVYDYFKLYEEKVVKFEKMNNYEKQISLSDFLAQLDALIVLINKEIQEWMLSFYRRVLNKGDNEDIPLSLVVFETLKKIGVDPKDILWESEIMIILNPVSYKELVRKK